MSKIADILTGQHLLQVAVHTAGGKFAGSLVQPANRTVDGRRHVARFGVVCRSEGGIDHCPFFGVEQIAIDGQRGFGGGN